VVDLIDELIHSVWSKRREVETVFIGQVFTVVKLISGDVGLAATPLRRFDSCIGVSKLAGKLAKRDSWELGQLLKSGNSHLRSVGLAAVNAVLQGELKQRKDFEEGDFLRFLRISPEDRVAMIDYYSTKIGLLKRGNLTIFDDRYVGKREDISILPMSTLKEELPKADIVIFPPTLLSKIDVITTFASKAREVAMVHPTTPPLPDPFFKRGITMVASMMITNPESLTRRIMEGAGTTLFKKFCRKIVFRRKAS
jgi:uncharacterized protein (DUF4213/DUF364 family)